MINEAPLCLLRGPVWVYVLERRRAVDVWNSLMGDADPNLARQLSPTSLRALYGISAAQNGLMGSPDPDSAEIQIASLFASSPPYPVTDLPDVTSTRMTASALAELQSSVASSNDNGYAHSTATNPSTLGTRRASFRARDIPPSHLTPDIVPRTTRAASLRAGIRVEKTPSSPRSPPTKEAIAKTFANVPGHKRAGSIAVASTAPPVIAPRMTRAASLRLGQQPPPKQTRNTASEGSARPSSVNKAVFEGVPGHKRRDSISVASTKAPTVAPRTNRSATLRLQKETAPPSSFNFRQVPATISRPSSQTGLNSVYARTPARPASASSVRPAEPTRTPSRDSSVRLSLSTATKRSLSPVKNGNTKPRPSSISAPTITPRTNKSAALRAAKLAGAPTNGKTRKISAFV